MKKIDKGITLIALVITIVVLIILATVIINLSLGDNGLFSRAREAKEQYLNSSKYEEEQIAKTTNEIDNYIAGNREQIMVDKDEYLQLKQDVEKIKNSEVVLDITSPASSSGWVVVHAFPDGYTKDNCIITGGYLTTASLGNYQINTSYSSWGLLAKITNNGIEMYVVDNIFFSRPGKIVIKKIT